MRKSAYRSTMVSGSDTHTRLHYSRKCSWPHARTKNARKILILNRKILVITAKDRPIGTAANIIQWARELSFSIQRTVERFLSFEQQNTVSADKCEEEEKEHEIRRTNSQNEYRNTLTNWRTYCAFGKQITSDAAQLPFFTTFQLRLRGTSSIGLIDVVAAGYDHTSHFGCSAIDGPPNDYFSFRKCWKLLDGNVFAFRSNIEETMIKIVAEFRRFFSCMGFNETMTDYLFMDSSVCHGIDVIVRRIYVDRQLLVGIVCETKAMLDSSE